MSNESFQLPNVANGMRHGRFQLLNAANSMENRHIQESKTYIIHYFLPFKNSSTKMLFHLLRPKKVRFFDHSPIVPPLYFESSSVHMC
jgi:hypothetical protein